MASKIMVPVALPEMAQVEEKLYKIIQESQGPTGEICTYLLKAGGKRMRPMLTLLSARCFCPKIPPAAITTAVAAELIHLASLIHDDIIDNADRRHGKLSLNARWGNKIAVLTGDYLFAKAFKILSQGGLYKVLELMIEAIEDMCSGEIEQALDSFNASQEEANYYRKIRKKTAKLIAVCCQSGALTGGASEENALSLRSFGLNLGYAFQIADDILDFTGKKEVLGKPTGLDLAQGNLTLPVLNLLKDETYGPWLKKVLLTKKLDEITHQRILEALIDSGALKKAQAAALAFSQKACHCLESLPSSPYRDTLKELALKAAKREY